VRLDGTAPDVDVVEDEVVDDPREVDDVLDNEVVVVVVDEVVLLVVVVFAAVE
jgi:hypothetical protein